MQVSITASNVLPVGSSVLINIPKYWPRSAVNNTYIFIPPPNCLPIANAAANIQCVYSQFPSIDLITITNLVASDTSGIIQFSIASIYNPPTIEPQGNIQIQTKVGNQRMEICSAVKMLGMTTSSLSSVSFSVTDYTVNAISKGYMQFKVSSIIKTTDTIQIGFPSTIILSNLASVLIVNGYVSNNNPQYSASNVLTLTGLSANSNSQVSLEFNDITNPPSQLSTTSFTLALLRNNYKMEELKTPLQFTAKRGQITSTSITSTTLEIGVIASYTIVCILSNALVADSILILTLPILYAPVTGFTCAPTPCSISGRVITYTSVTSMSGYPSLNLRLDSIPNPLTLGTTSSFTINTQLYSAQASSKVDQATSTISLTFVGRKLQVSDVTISANSLVVYNYPTTFTLRINNNNPIPAYSHIEIELPPTIITTAKEVACIIGGVGIACTYSDISNKIILSPITDTQRSVGYLATQPIDLLNIYNPPSTKTTATFKVVIVNSEGSAIQYLDNSLTFSANIPATFNTLSLAPNNTINSANTLLTVSFSVSMTEINGSVLVLTFPNKIDTQSITCSVVSPNLQSVSCTKSASQVKARVTYSALNAGETSFSIATYKNFPSLQPYTIAAVLFETTLQLSKIASSSVLLVNNVLAAITIHSFSFSNPVLFELSDLIFSFTPTATANSIISKIEVILSEEYGVSSAGSCVLPVGVTCSLIGKAYTITTTGTFAFPLSATLQQVTTPTITPSSPLYIQTYSSSNYLMDRDYSIRFQTACTLPCKQCSPNVVTCTMCYSNGLLVSSQTSLAAGKCEAACPLGQYLDSLDSTCKNCASICQTCQNFNQCLSCKVNTYLYSQTCVGSCPFGFYQFGAQCVTCPVALHCQSCSNSSQCLTCLGGYFMYQTQCISTCPADITYTDTLNRLCKDCPNNCTQCSLSGSIVSCTVCLAGYLLDNGRCYLTCQTVSTVPNGSLCTGCASICQTCSKTTTNCTSCDTTSSSPYLFNNFCLATCPAGFYPNIATFSCNICTSPCQLCTSVSVSSCVSCITGYLLLSNTCLQNCPATYYPTATTCIKCVSPCSQCTSQLQCKSCVSGFYLFGKTCVTQCNPGMTIINNNQCLVCAPQCKTCSTSTYCTSCYGSIYLYNGNCVPTCTSGTYPDNNNLVCINCVSPCNYCSSVNYCLSCINTALFLENGNCVPVCTIPLIPVGNICTSCQSNCDICVGTTTHCLKCASSYYFYSNNFTCSLTCTLNSFTNNSVLTCIVDCPPGFYSASQICTVCPTGCIQCTAADKCSVCNTANNYSLYNNFCFNPCPILAPYSVDGICVICIKQHCQTCLNSTHCSICSTGYILIYKSSTSECIQSCPSGSSYNPATFTCDQTNSGNTNGTNNNGTNTNNTNTNGTTVNTSQLSGVLPEYLWLMVSGGMVLIVALSKFQFSQMTNIVICAFMLSAILTSGSIAHILYIEFYTLSSLGGFITMPLVTYLIVGAGCLVVLLNLVAFMCTLCIRDYAIIDLFEQRPLLMIGLMCCSLLDHRVLWVLHSGLYGWKPFTTKYIKQYSLYMINFLLFGSVLQYAICLTYAIMQIIIPSSTSHRLLLEASSVPNAYPIQLAVLSGLGLLCCLGIIRLHKSSYYDSSRYKDQSNGNKSKQLLTATDKFGVAKQEHNQSQQQLNDERLIFDRRFGSNSSLLHSMGDQLGPDQFSRNYNTLKLSQIDESEIGKNQPTDGKDVTLSQVGQNPKQVQPIVNEKISKVEIDIQVDMGQWLIEDLPQVLMTGKENVQIQTQRLRQTKTGRLSISRNVTESVLASQNSPRNDYENLRQQQQTISEYGSSCKEQAHQDWNSSLNITEDKVQQVDIIDKEREIPVVNEAIKTYKRSENQGYQSKGKGQIASEIDNQQDPQTYEQIYKATSRLEKTPHLSQERSQDGQELIYKTEEDRQDQLLEQQPEFNQEEGQIDSKQKKQNPFVLYVSDEMQLKKAQQISSIQIKEIAEDIEIDFIHLDDQQDDLVQQQDQLQYQDQKIENNYHRKQSETAQQFTEAKRETQRQGVAPNTYRSKLEQKKMQATLRDSQFQLSSKGRRDPTDFLKNIRPPVEEGTIKEKNNLYNKQVSQKSYRLRIEEQNQKINTGTNDNQHKVSENNNALNDGSQPKKQSNEAPLQKIANRLRPITGNKLDRQNSQFCTYSETGNYANAHKMYGRKKNVSQIQSNRSQLQNEKIQSNIDKQLEQGKEFLREQQRGQQAPQAKELAPYQKRQDNKELQSERVSNRSRLKQELGDYQMKLQQQESSKKGSHVSNQQQQKHDRKGSQNEHQSVSISQVSSKLIESGESERLNQMSQLHLYGQQDSNPLKNQISRVSQGHQAQYQTQQSFNKRQTEEEGQNQTKAEKKVEAQHKTVNMGQSKNLSRRSSRLTDRKSNKNKQSQLIPQHLQGPKQFTHNEKFSQTPQSKSEYRDAVENQISRASKVHQRAYFNSEVRGQPQLTTGEKNDVQEQEMNSDTIRDRIEQEKKNRSGLTRSNVLKSKQSINENLSKVTNNEVKIIKDQTKEETTKKLTKEVENKEEENVRQKLQLAAPKTNRTHLIANTPQLLPSRMQRYSLKYQDERIQKIKQNQDQVGKDYNSELDDATKHNQKNQILDQGQENLLITDIKDCIFVQDPSQKDQQQNYQVQIQKGNRNNPQSPIKDMGASLLYVDDDFSMKNSQIPGKRHKRTEESRKSRTRVISFQEDLDELDQVLPDYKKTKEMPMQELQLEQDQVEDAQKPSNLLRGIQTIEHKDPYRRRRETQRFNTINLSRYPPRPPNRDQQFQNNRSQLRPIRYQQSNNQYQQPEKAKSSSRGNGYLQDDAGSDKRPSELLRSSFKKIGEMVLDKTRKY